MSRLAFLPHVCCLALQPPNLERPRVPVLQVRKLRAGACSKRGTPVAMLPGPSTCLEIFVA